MDYIDDRGFIYKDVKTGPKGGLYVIKNGKKIYLKKENLQLHNPGRNSENKESGRNSTITKKPTVQTLIYPIADYEHEGDIQHEKNYILSKYPYVLKVEGFEERDYEAEADYKEEYGELDEYIYQGYVKVTLPTDKVEEFTNNYQA